MARRRHALPLALAELAVAAPQVVSHRLARMAAAGPLPGAADQREFHRMGAEKVAAFWESWAAMGLQSWSAQQRALAAMQSAWWRTLWFPLAKPGAGAFGPSTAQLQRQTLDMLAHGLAPVHRRAVANAKRLGKPRRRR